MKKQASDDEKVCILKLITEFAIALHTLAFAGALCKFKFKIFLYLSTMYMQPAADVGQ
jgi:hypothetical protein